MYYERFFAGSGGLISYGPDYVDQYRRAAGYIVLKGEKPTAEVNAKRLGLLPIPLC
jgi:hypothetical protein